MAKAISVRRRTNLPDASGDTMLRADDVPMEHWPDDRLLKAAHSGNPEAFRVFCVRSLPTLLRWLRARCRQHNLPEDLAADFAQETVLRALEAAVGHEEEGRPWPKVTMAWLFTIGHHLMLDWLRKNRRHQALEDAESVAASPSEATAADYEEVLERLNQLRVREREILELVFIDGLDIGMAGMRMGLKKWTAYKVYERALKALRDGMVEQGDEDVSSR